MTASLLVFVPIALLGLIAAFCFVGCSLPVSGLPADKFLTYSDSDVIGNKFCVAYWPLGEPEPDPATGDSIAPDVVGKNHGTYKSVDINAGKYHALFPCPDFDLGGGLHSALAPGTLTTGAPGIVQGDTVPPHDPDNFTLTKATQVNGGFVEVPFGPFSNVINRDAPFTIEAWVRPEWDLAATPALRVFIDSRGIVDGVVHGYALLVNAAGSWEAAFSVAGPVPTVLVTAGPASLTVPTHVVLTFDGNNAALFINGAQSLPPTSLQGSTFTPNTTSSLVIGVGLPWLSPRMNPGDNLFFPLLPFKGKIQDVAIYSVVLDPVTIMNHAQHGQGNVTG